MSKVLVDRELLEQIVNTNMGDYALIALQHKELLAILAQPAAAEGVDFGFDDRSVKVSQEAYSIFLERERHHLAALSAVTAERDRLLASKLYWVAPAGSGLVRCVTDERYRKFAPSIRAKYDPVCCVDAAMAAKEA